MLYNFSIKFRANNFLLFFVVVIASANVELTVQRNNYKMPRPSSVTVSPSTPLAQRGGITGPKPVDV